MPDQRLVDVAVPLPVAGALTYAVPEAVPLPVPGARVGVPVARRHMIGVCMGNADPSCRRSYAIRNITGCLDDSPLLPSLLIEFLKWIAEYYYYPLGKVISEALPPGFLSAKESGISRILRTGSARGRSRFHLKKWERNAEFVLHEQQERALSFLEDSLHKAEYCPVLLYGVTGSGKTEVYIRAAAKCMGLGRHVLVMVPEIAMTAQTAGWFGARFGSMLSVLHSGMTDAQRRDQWWRIRSKESSIVVGTRSSVFAPFSDIGLIIVDEEHDSSYKQSEKLRYNARDLALVLGRLSGATVLLGSATPSLSSYTNALNGKYHLLKFPRRVADRALPEVVIVDRRLEKKKQGARGRRMSGRGTWLTPALAGAMAETLERGEQVMLFLNRRGFATYVFCPDCGHVFRCGNCDVTMTWHRGAAPDSSAGTATAMDCMQGFLKCHYCGAEAPALQLCPACGGHAVKAFGYGTEKVETEVREMFPGICSARIDRDTVSSSRRLQEIVTAFRAGEIDLLVGTQMITKGHDFPGLTLVGILWADMGLNVPEFNAAERTFQLITQVAGRSGRGERPGRVIVQTWMADHYAVETACAQDYETFYARESVLRRQLLYAPFSRMINFRFSGMKNDAVIHAADNFAQLARRLCAATGGGSPESRVDILGPAPAPRARIKNRYRSQLLMKSRAIFALRSLCSQMLAQQEKLILPGVRLEVDVDPDSML